VDRIPVIDWWRFADLGEGRGIWGNDRNKTDAEGLPKNDGKVNSKGLSKPLTVPSRPWPRPLAELSSRQTPPPQQLRALGLDSAGLLMEGAPRDMPRLPSVRASTDVLIVVFV
jgi:hypothetical protein